LLIVGSKIEKWGEKTVVFGQGNDRTAIKRDRRQADKVGEASRTT